MIVFSAISYVFAGGNDATKTLFTNLTRTIKDSKAVSWTYNDQYSQGSFNFNGTKVSAFYSPDGSSLIGYSLEIGVKGLTQDMVQAVAKKYPNWTIVNAVYFIENQKTAKYFVQVFDGKRQLALQISQSGRVSLFSRM